MSKSQKKHMSVAIIGASADRTKFSNKAVRAYLREGWDVYPVNPKGGEIEGLPVYANIGQIPIPIRRVSLYLPPPAGMLALASIAQVKPDEFFVNPGAESDELISTAVRLGLKPILACSIVEIGASPAEFPH